MIETIVAQEIGLRIEGDSDVLNKVVDSLHEAYKLAGMDMPKQLHDAVYTISRELGNLDVPGYEDYKDGEG